MLRPIYRHLAHYPSFSAIVAGLIGFIAVLCFFGLLLLQMLEAEVQQDYAQAGRRLERIKIELAKSFDHLQQHIPADCDDAALDVMRRRLLYLLSIRAFGVLNEQGQLVCLSSEGVLAAPKALPPPRLAGFRAKELVCLSD